MEGKDKMTRWYMDLRGLEKPRLVEFILMPAERTYMYLLGLEGEVGCRDEVGSIHNSVPWRGALAASCQLFTGVKKYCRAYQRFGVHID